jgi:hypothetical protein
MPPGMSSDHCTHCHPRAGTRGNPPREDVGMSTAADVSATGLKAAAATRTAALYMKDAAWMFSEMVATLTALSDALDAEYSESPPDPRPASASPSCGSPWRTRNLAVDTGSPRGSSASSTAAAPPTRTGPLDRPDRPPAYSSVRMDVSHLNDRERAIITGTCGRGGFYIRNKEGTSGDKRAARTPEKSWIGLYAKVMGYSVESLECTVADCPKGGRVGAHVHFRPVKPEQSRMNTPGTLAIVPLCPSHNHISSELYRNYLPSRERAGVLFITEAGTPGTSGT